MMFGFEQSWHLAFLLAAGAKVERHGVEGAHRMAVDDSIRILRQSTARQVA